MGVKVNVAHLAHNEEVVVTIFTTAKGDVRILPLLGQNSLPLSAPKQTLAIILQHVRSVAAQWRLVLANWFPATQR